MELGGRCPCGAVMGELGQNKQPTTHREKYRNTNTKYRNTNTQYRNTNTKYRTIGELRETINGLLTYWDFNSLLVESKMFQILQ